MTIDNAIERVRGRFFERCAFADHGKPSCGNCVLCLDNQALRLVLERAKEPRVYALSAEHRRTLLAHKPGSGYAMLREAIDVALALQEPFTVEELELMHDGVSTICSDYETSSNPQTEAYALAAKLRAYIEARKEKSS